MSEYRQRGDDFQTRSGQTVAKIRGTDLVSPNGSTLLRIRGEEIVDTSGNVKAKIRGDDVVDRSGNRIGRVSDIRRMIDDAAGGATVVAFWLQFLR